MENTTATQKPGEIFQPITVSKGSLHQKMFDMMLEKAKKENDGYDYAGITDQFETENDIAVSEGIIHQSDITYELHFKLKQ